MKKIKNIEKIEYNDYVYSLNVEDNHNFYLDNDILSKNCLIILDEAQNATMKQLMMIVTRMGNNSKVIISGDIRQYDIKKNDVALPFLIDNVFNGIQRISNFEFNEDDIMRNSILIEIVKRYEKLKFEGKIPKNF